MNLRQLLKFQARGFLKSAKPSPQLIGMSGLGIITILNFLAGRVTNETARSQILTKAFNLYQESQNFDQLVDAVTSVQLSFAQTALDVLLSLMVLMISTGIIIYVITEARYHKGDFGNLLDGLPILTRVLCYQLVTWLLTALWSLLLVIPGIIAQYRYRQGLYILLDHPEMRVMECIKASKHMMHGHKMELFWLDLSFFGWLFGESFMLTILAAALGGNSYLPSLLLLPLSAFIRMYMEFTLFLYYEHLHGVHYDSRIPNAEVG